eukprot:2223326-Pyramimonas_sp.AAC.1
MHGEAGVGDEGRVIRTRMEWTLTYRCCDLLHGIKEPRSADRPGSELQRGFQRSHVGDDVRAPSVPEAPYSLCSAEVVDANATRHRFEFDWVVKRA